VHWWRGREARNVLVPAAVTTPPQPGWAKPPYVFKSAKEARAAAEDPR
jgi:hypothetical protein